MPPLQRANSCTDIGFTLRQQFHKDEFRYLSFWWIYISEQNRTQLTLLKRPHQREIIETALSGHDVYVQAATSFGKSLCFQLPAVIDQGSELGYIRLIFQIVENEAG